jgi:hypothetical protein
MGHRPRIGSVMGRGIPGKGILAVCKENKTNKFMDYVKSRSFFWYLSHYPI